MSKFEDLCKAYAAARKEYRDSCQACQEFSEIFVRGMSDYFECPVSNEKGKFDGNGELHFNASLTLWENPELPEDSEREDLTVSLSVRRVIDNYILTVYPWMREFKILIDEPAHFEEAYDYIFDRLKETYLYRDGFGF